MTGGSAGEGREGALGEIPPLRRGKSGGIVQGHERMVFEFPGPWRAYCVIDA